MSLFAKVLNGFFTILRGGNIYPKVNLVPDGSQTRLGRVDDPIHDLDAANKRYVDSKAGGLPAITENPPADITADGYIQVTVNGVTIQLFGKLVP